MTTEELERDLTMIAERREADERLRLAIEARLGEQMLVRPTRRLRPWLGFGWAAAAAAALAAAIVSLGWPAGSAGRPPPTRRSSATRFGQSHCRQTRSSM